MPRNCVLRSCLEKRLQLPQRRRGGGVLRGPLPQQRLRPGLDQLRAQLRLWLSLTEGAGGAKPSEEGLRLRLAALAACGIASARQSTELQLPRLLYTGR